MNGVIDIRAIWPRVERRRKALGIKTMAELERRLGMGRFMSDWKRGAEGSEKHQGVDLDKLAALAPILETSFNWLLDESGPEEINRPGVPILGYVSAGGEAHFVSDGELERIEVRGVPPVTQVGVKVRGDSMEPTFFDGMYLLYDKQPGPPLPHLLVGDFPLIIWLESGGVYVKKVIRGSREGTFHLQSTNPKYPPIVDVRIAAVALIQAIIPPRPA